jgi:NADH-quinone oxidoreductase subunit M
MIAHGFVSGAMFLCIGVLYDRVHSREIAAYGGVVNTMPRFGAFALLFFMANCGLPGTAGFVGEWMVILGAVRQLLDRPAAATALISARLQPVDVQARVFRRRGQRQRAPQLPDINWREFRPGLLAIAVLGWACIPSPSPT